MSVQSLCNMRCWIYSVTNTRDSYGANIESFTPKYSNIPCRARYISGMESIIDGKEMNAPIWRLYLSRQYSVLASDLIIDEKDRKWDILYVNRMNRKGHMQIDSILINAMAGQSCPNVIKSVTASVIVGDPGMTFDKYVTVEINSSNTKNQFLPLYTYSISGKTMSDKTFFGDTNSTSKTSAYYVSLLINGVKYWMPKYNGTSTVSCCSNIIGEEA